MAPSAVFTSEPSMDNTSKVNNLILPPARLVKGQPSAAVKAFNMGYSSKEKGIKAAIHKAIDPSPHFMSPTVSSTGGKDGTSATASSSAQAEAPPLPAIESTKSRGWLKRVGISRVPASTLRSKKEVKPEQVSRMAFPDKLAIDSSQHHGDTPLTVSRSSTTDKPLPSPPIAQVIGSELIESPRSLIDASEKPLRRRSSSKARACGDEWPVLFPTQPTTPTTLRMVAASGEFANTLDYTSPTEERYPALVNADIAPVVKAQVTVAGSQSDAKSGHSKETSRKPVKPVKSYIVDNTLQDKREAVKDTNDKKPEDDMVSDMSPSAAALEKFEANSARNFSMPSPKGTATLRARILSPTAFEKPKEASQDITTQSEPKTGTASQIVSNHDQHSAVGHSAENDQLQIPRPGSGNGGRGRFPIVPQPSKATFSSRVASFNRTKDQMVAEIVAAKELAPKSVNNRSSIPVLVNKKVRLSQSHLDDDAESPCQVASLKIKAKSARGSTSSLFQDAPAYDADDEANKHKATTKDEPKSISRQTPFEEDVGHSKTVEILGTGHVRTLSDVPEDKPPVRSSVRPLSKSHPDYGATLTISEQAESVIYGDQKMDESKSYGTKGSEAVKRRSITPNDLLGIDSYSKAASAVRKLRPRSAHGLESNDTSRTQVLSSAPKSMVPQSLASRDETDPFIDTPGPATGLGAKSTTASSTRTDRAQIARKISAEKSKVATIESTDISAKVTIDSIPEAGLTAAIPDHDGLQRLRAAQKSLQQAHGSNTQIPTPNHGNRQTAGFARPTSSSGKRARSPISQARPESPTHKRPSTPSGIHPVHRYPPRSSSLTPVEGASGRNSGQRNLEKQPISKEVKGLAGNLSGSAALMSDTKAVGEAGKRRSSHGTGRSLLSMRNIRGLFHKTDTEKKITNSKTRSNEKAKIPTAVVAPAEDNPAHEAVGSIPQSFSPMPVELLKNFDHLSHEQVIDDTAGLATQILTYARDERSNAKKERLLEMGKVMVDAITSARDAGVAMEQAKMAAGKAEVSYMLTRRSVMDVSRMVKEWKKIMDGGKMSSLKTPIR